MDKMLEDIATIINLQLQILVKRRAITQSEHDIILDNMKEDSPIADLIPILQVLLRLDKEEDNV
jgi:hypothetical protein